MLLLKIGIEALLSLHCLTSQADTQYDKTTCKKIFENEYIKIEGQMILQEITS